MPVDKDGNVADIIMDPGSSINRTNPGRLYAQYLGAASRDIRKSFLEILKIGENYLKSKSEEGIYNDLVNNQTNYIECLNKLETLYRIVSPIQHEYFVNASMEEKLTHFVHILKDRIIFFKPPDPNFSNIEMVKEIENHFDLTYDRVSYVDDSGKLVTTKKRIRIAPMYFMLLEKIGDSWSAVSSGRLQMFGILSGVVKNEKYSYPFRKSPVKTVSETESRLYAAYCGPKAIAEMMDRNNNPITHKYIVKEILNAPQPTNIKKVIDRNLVPYGNTKPLQLMNHIFLCYGFQYTYKPESK